MRLLIFFLLLSLGADAQIIRANPFYRPTVTAAQLLLDSFPNAAVCYSVRKLKQSYTGSAIKVRRKSDNSEQDIGFVNNDLDTVSLKNFVGTASTDTGWVTTWYDQLNNRNATQSTANRQPRIITSGKIEYVSGKPSIFFTSNIMTFNRFDISAGYSFIVYRRTSNINSTLFMVRRSSDNYKAYQFAVNASAGFGPILVGSKDSSVRWGQGGTVGTNTNRLLTGYWNGTAVGGSSNYSAFVNGSSITLSNSNIITFSNYNQNSSIGGEIDNSNALSNTMAGYLSEIIFYSSDQTSNRTGIETNIINYYGL